MKKSKNINNDVLIEKMRNGDEAIITSCVFSETPIIALNSIMFGTINGVMNKDFISEVEKLTDSDVTFLGNPLSAFAIAALHILDIKKYTGNDEFIINLINSKMEFVR